MAGVIIVETLKNKLTSEGKGGLVGENGWPKVPLEINNEEVVGLQDGFIEGFRGCKDQDNVYK